MMIFWFILFCFLMIISFAFGTLLGGEVLFCLIAKRCPKAFAELEDALDVDIEVRSRYEGLEEDQGAEM